MKARQGTDALHMDMIPCNHRPGCCDAAHASSSPHCQDGSGQIEFPELVTKRDGGCGPSQSAVGNWLVCGVIAYEWPKTAVLLVTDHN